MVVVVRNCKRRQAGKKNLSALNEVDFSAFVSEWMLHLTMRVCPRSHLQLPVSVVFIITTHSLRTTAPWVITADACMPALFLVIDLSKRVS